MAALRLTSITLCPAAAAASAASPSSAGATPRAASFACAVARGLPCLRLAPPSRRRGDLVRPRAAAANAASDNYASALCEVASENGTLEETVSDLEKLERIFSEEAIAEFFDNPTVPREEKGELIDEIAKSIRFLSVFTELLASSSRASPSRAELNFWTRLLNEPS